jgi:2-(1,2-epoxy-1,2-dihydrophenyl)acetyl-CoA isomerase
VLLTERRGGVLVLTLNRPEVGNAYNDELRFTFLDTLRKAEQDNEIRAVVLTGTGKHFCTGADLTGEANLTAEGYRGNTQRYDWIAEVQRVPVPVIAAIEGYAAGAGMALAMACDVRVIAEDGHLFPAFTQRGLAPDSGVSWALTNIVGPGQAMQWLLDATRIPAADALNARLVQHVVPAGQALERALEIAERWAHGPTVAFALAKRQVWAALNQTLPEALRFEQDSRFLTYQTYDRIEGRTAFQEKRPPQFKGQ